MSDANSPLPLDDDDPTHIFGRRVIGKCSACEGEGRIWCFHTEEGVTLEWKEPCETCNHLGYFLDDEPDDDIIPF